MIYLVNWLLFKQIFVLSAVSPEKMQLVLQNIKNVLKVMITLAICEIHDCFIFVEIIKSDVKPAFSFSQTVLCFSVTMPLVTLLRFTIYSTFSSRSIFFLFYLIRSYFIRYLLLSCYKDALLNLKSQF